MKKIKTALILFTFFSVTAMGQVGQIQNVKIVSFTVKNKLTAIIDNWNNVPGALLLVAQIPPSIKVDGIRLMLQIRSGGAVVCGNNSTGGIAVDQFTTRSFTTAELTSSLSSCHELKDGSYSICAQFFNIDRVAISNEVCKEFTVETPKEIDYSPPSLITPDNGKSYTEAELQRPVMFRWTPIVPKPTAPVTYRLRVWQLMQGQNGMQAMRSNQPIITKEVDNITQAVVTGIITGPCKPPYMCDFIWNVQAVNREGKPMGRNEGTSEPWTFKATSSDREIKAPVNAFPENNKSFSLDEIKGNTFFKWKPVEPKQSGQVTYRLKVWQLMQGQNGTQAMRSNQPIVTKEVTDATELTACCIITGPCKPPYMCDFVWNIEAIISNAAGQTPNTFSSEPTSFTVKNMGEVPTGEIKPPVNILPDNNKSFSANEATGAIKFTWKPVDPKQSSPVTYRLRVWQLMQGQNGNQAMRSNQPIITKEVDNITQAVVTGVITGPCRPPYMCDFIWDVQALDRLGHPLGSNEGTSGATIFTVKNNGDISTGEIHPPVNVTPVDNKSFSLDEAKGPIRFSWKGVDPQHPGPVTYRLRVWQLMQGQTGQMAMKTNQPIVTKEVNDITEAMVSGVITGPCRPPYMCDFVWNVEAMMGNSAGVPGKTLASEPTTFNVKETGVINPPVNILPEDNKSFSLEQAKGAIRFTWKPVDPQQSGPIKYRLRVWQLMQGQTGQMAMKANQPIVTKDVNDLTEAMVTGVITGPCKPPYMCDFIWDVQAFDKSGHPVGNNEGTSEPTTFKVQNNIDTQIDSLKVGCCTDGKQSIYIKVKNNLASNVNIVAIKYKINGAGAAIPLAVSPSLVQMIPGNGSQVFTATVDCITNATFLKFLVDAEDVTDPDNKETEVANDTLHCACDACSDKNIKFNIQPPNNIVINGNNTLTLNQPITITTTPPKLVKSIKAELVYFEFVPESEDCLPCNKDSKTFGNFDNGTLANTTGLGGGTHSLLWNFSPPKNFSGGGNTAAITITIPPTVKCCDATIRWCIRYVVTFEDCTVCNKLVCYEKKKEGCAKGNPNPNGQK